MENVHHRLKQSEEQQEKIIELLEKNPEYKQILDLEIIENND